MRIFPVILSGGAGTRLWPLSRSLYPKQFIRLANNPDRSLLQATAQRLPPDQGFEAPTLVCNNAHRFLIRDELEETRISPREIILEPVGRNTAPAVAVAALSCAKDDAKAILAVMPSDHVIADAMGFAKAVRNAAAVARTGKLVLLGVQPTAAHTGFGYIKSGEELPGTSSGACAVAEFKEKPDVATAEAYFADGGYLWNSGIFVLQASSFLAELERLAPEILAAAKSALERAEEDLGFLRLQEAAFAESPSISLDYAVMEKTAAAAVLPLELGWSDVGSWSAMWELAPRDEQGNAIDGDSFGLLQETQDCFIHSERPLVATLGLDNVVIVDTPDALLVADKARTEDVGDLVTQLKTRDRSEHAQHIRGHRPWGYFEPLSIGPRHQVKLLHVKPGAKSSLQMHHHRSEHWVVVKGTAKVTIGDVEKLISENESVYITATQWHRLENPGKVPLEIIEVQIGTYLGEDDIIRSDDLYRRPESE